MPKEALSTFYSEHQASIIGWTAACLTSLSICLSMYDVTMSLWGLVIVFAIMAIIPGVLVGVIACWLYAFFLDVVYIFFEVHSAIPSSRRKKGRNIR